MSYGTSAVIWKLTSPRDMLIVEASTHTKSRTRMQASPIDNGMHKKQTRGLKTRF